MTANPQRLERYITVIMRLALHNTNTWKHKGEFMKCHQLGSFETRLVGRLPSRALPVADRLYKEIVSRLRRLTNLLGIRALPALVILRAHPTTHGTKFFKLAVKSSAQASQENVKSNNEISPSPTSKVRLTHSTPPGRLPL